MIKYYIEDELGCFWCQEPNIGYWIKNTNSLKHRVEGTILILILFTYMKFHKVKANLKKVNYEILEYNVTKRGLCYLEIEIDGKIYLGVLKETK